MRRFRLLVCLLFNIQLQKNSIIKEEKWREKGAQFLRSRVRDIPNLVDWQLTPHIGSIAAFQPVAKLPNTVACLYDKQTIIKFYSNLDPPKNLFPEVKLFYTLQVNYVDGLQNFNLPLVHNFKFYMWSRFGCSTRHCYMVKLFYSPH